MEMTKEQLYNNAKEAYYNGQPIMSDIEFDELESELGLENKGYVGTRHNPSYTIKVNGKKLYEYARNNIPVELPKKMVTISSIEIIGDIEYAEGKINFKIKI